MTILITGIAGFIGSHIGEKLLSMGHTIVGVDNFDPFYSKKIKLTNLTQLNDSSKFFFYECDIRDKLSIDPIFKKHKIDVVAHLAAKAGVRPSIDSITEYYDVNVNGTVCLLESMRINKVNKMIFASSSSVYGNNLKVPFSENDSVDTPISPYASTKKSGELLCHVYYHLHKFDITCLRFFTVFGPRQRPDLAIHKFTRLIEKGSSIPFYGDGSTARDYTYIEDIVDGIYCAFNHLNGFRIYNIGESHVISLNKMVESIEKSIGRKAQLELLPLQQGDVNITYADISKAKKEIGYMPKYNFETGLKEFVKWFLEHKKDLI